MKTAVRKKIVSRFCGIAGVSLCLFGCASRSEFQNGYDRGSADTVKHQYWIQQNLQRGEKESPYRLTYYRFTVPPDPKAPVKTVPQQIAIPVYE